MHGLRVLLSSSPSIGQVVENTEDIDLDRTSLLLLEKLTSCGGTATRADLFEAARRAGINQPLSLPPLATIRESSVQLAGCGRSAFLRSVRATPRVRRHWKTRLLKALRADSLRLPPSAPKT